MSEPYLGEIIAVGFFFGNGFSQSWLPCNGQLLPISQYEALYSLIGTIYGGDGLATFGLPNLNGDGTPAYPGRVAICQGAGAGLSNRVMGQQLGVEEVTLLANQLAGHTHHMQLAQAGTSDATPAPERAAHRSRSIRHSTASSPRIPIPTFPRTPSPLSACRSRIPTSSRQTASGI